MLYSLCTDLLLEIFGFLDFKDLLNIGETCKKFNKLYRNNDLWKALYYNNEMLENLYEYHEHLIYCDQLLVIGISREELVYKHLKNFSRAVLPEIFKSTDNYYGRYSAKYSLYMDNIKRNVKLRLQKQSSEGVLHLPVHGLLGPGIRVGVDHDLVEITNKKLTKKYMNFVPSITRGKSNIPIFQKPYKNPKLPNNGNKHKKR